MPLKILLDECVPHLVKKELPGLDISIVQDMGWAGMKNGDLLRLVEKQFDVFIIADQSFQYQQNLSGLKLAIILLPSNQVPVVAKLIPEIARHLQTIQPGAFLEIQLPAVR